MVDTAVFGIFHRSRLPTAPSQAVRSKQPDATADQVVPAGPFGWAGTPGLQAESIDADQLGLAHPAAVTLAVKLLGFDRVELEASRSGVYQPVHFRSASWSGFADEPAPDSQTGLVAGTRILTSRGEIEVESLGPGDVALALRGPALVPIVWIGRRTTAGAFIRIETGALGPNLPRRVLCVAPDQAIFLDPSPVIARSLVNGTTIRLSGSTEAELFQIDLGCAEILLAEGLPLATGDRNRLSPRQ